MTRSPPWTNAENAALAKLYFAMLDKALTGEPYNKAAMIRYEQRVDEHLGEIGPLYSRSRGSIEAKLMNASAAHRALRRDAATMADYGYVPLANYQSALKDVIKAHITGRELGVWYHKRVTGQV